MDTVEIADLLETKHQELFTWLENQPQENWELGPEKKMVYRSTYTTFSR